MRELHECTEINIRNVAIYYTEKEENDKAVYFRTRCDKFLCEPEPPPCLLLSTIECFQDLEKYRW